MKKHAVLIWLSGALTLFLFGKWMALNTIILSSFMVTLSILFIFEFAIPRIRMLGRAKVMESEFADPENTVIYIQFTSFWSNRKQNDIDTKKNEMAEDGWVFLKASEASHSKTRQSIGGGLNLHFIREKSRENRDRTTAIYS